MTLINVETTETKTYGIFHYNGKLYEGNIDNNTGMVESVEIYYIRSGNEGKKYNMIVMEMEIQKFGWF